jgi:hypothetical protein
MVGNDKTMYSNLNGLKTTKMKARKLLDKEEFDYDHFTRLTSTGIEPDYNTIAQFAEKYHQNQLKLLNIDSVRLSLPTDIQIEETADVAYKHVREHFPINDEYCYTQGYINGMTALRNNIQNNEA